MEREPDGGFGFSRMVRLAPPGGDGRGVWCGEDGVFIGPGIALVERHQDEFGAVRFAAVPAGHLRKVLGYGYDRPVDAAPWLPGLGRVAAALEKGDLALANIALVQMRIPPFADALGAELAAVVDKLSKEWVEDEHPRHPAGAPDSQGGRFAPKGEGGTVVVAGTATTAAAAGPGVAPLFGNLAPRALAALSELGATVLALVTSPPAIATGAAAAFLGILFLPGNRNLISQGALPGLPDTSYRYGEDGHQLDLWRNGQLLFSGQAGSDGIFRDKSGNAFGRLLDGSVALDQDAVAAMAVPQKWPETDPDEAATPTGAATGAGAVHLAAAQTDVHPANDNDPKACPDPGADRPGGKSQDAINYQVQISGLPILPDGTPMAVMLNGVVFDGCRLSDGHMLEAKGIGLDWAMNMSDDWRRENWAAAQGLLEQAKRQSRAAPNRIIEWHFAEPRVAAYFAALFEANDLKNILVVDTPYVRPAKP